MGPGYRNCCAFLVWLVLTVQAARGADIAAEKAWSEQINTGKFLVAQMQASKAEQAYLAAVKWAETLDSFHKALALCTLGHYYLDRNRSKEAETRFSEALELSKQSDAADTEIIKAWAYGGFADLYKATKEQSKHDDATKAADTAKAKMLNGIPKWQTYLQNTSSIVSKGWKDHKSRLTVLNPRPVGVYCRIRKDGTIDCLMIWKSSGALELDQDAVKAVSALSPLPAMDPSATSNLAATYMFGSNAMDHNQIEMSEKDLLHELEKTAVKGDTQRIRALLTLAALARVKNNRIDAEKYLGQALQLAQEEPADASVLMQVDLALADYHRQYSEFGKSIEYAQKALDYSKNMNNSDVYSYCLELKANMLMKSGKTEDALKCFAELANLKKAKETVK